jgi:hypothetical protein
MPVSYQFDGRLAVIKMETEYSLGALTEAIHASVGDPKCPAHPDLLLDATAAFVPLGLTAADLHALGRLLTHLGTERCRSIALIAGSEITNGLMRACAAHAEAVGVRIRVCRSAAAAREWLGHPAADAAAGALFGSVPQSAAACAARP